MCVYIHTYMYIRIRVCIKYALILLESGLLRVKFVHLI